MKYLFFGTPEFSAIILGKLIEVGFVPAGVICNPDRPVGRKKIITPPLTKSLAIKYGIPVYQPKDFANFKFEILNFKFDFAVVAAYSKIIPRDIIDLFPKGIIGVHPSLLPKYRGAAPIQSAILNGDMETGVTLYAMDEKVDHGKIIASREIDILKDDIYETLEKRMAETAGDLLIETLPKFAKSEMKLVPQDESQATFTKKFMTQDGFVDLIKDDPIMIERRVRALNPEPGTWTFQQVRGKPVRMKILEAEIKDGKLALKKIQYEGKKPQTV